MKKPQKATVDFVNFLKTRRGLKFMNNLEKTVDFLKKKNVHGKEAITALVMLSFKLGIEFRKTKCDRGNDEYIKNVTIFITQAITEAV